MSVLLLSLSLRCHVHLLFLLAPSRYLALSLGTGCWRGGHRPLDGLWFVVDVAVVIVSVVVLVVVLAAALVLDLLYVFFSLSGVVAGYRVLEGASCRRYIAFFGAVIAIVIMILVPTILLLVSLSLSLSGVIAGYRAVANLSSRRVVFVALFGVVAGYCVAESF